MLGRFQCRLELLLVGLGQGPAMLAIRAGRSCEDIFLSLSSIICLVFLPLSLLGGHGGGQIKTEILSQRAVKPKHPINQKNR